MQELTRRDVLRWLTVTAAGGALAPALEGLAGAIEARGGPPELVWFNGSGGQLNFLAHLGHEHPGLLERIAGRWVVAHLDPLLAAPHVEPTRQFRGPPVVVLESLPSPEAWQRPEGTWLSAVIAKARTVVLLGSEACFGVLGASQPDLARTEALCEEHGTPLIKLPGIPVPPHHLVGTLAHLERIGFPRLDVHRRPELYYGETVCRRCERRGDLENGVFAGAFGEPGCLLRLGCKGPVTHNTCSVHKWNGGVSWCVGAGGPCTGCSAPGFPDHGGLGLYGRLSASRHALAGTWLAHLEGLGWGFFGLAALGFAFRLVRRAVRPPAAELPAEGRRGGA